MLLPPRRNAGSVRGFHLQSHSWIFPPQTEMCRQKQPGENPHCLPRATLDIPILTPKGCLGGQGFSTAPGSAWAGGSKHTQHPRVCLLKGGRLLLHHTEELRPPKRGQNPPKPCFMQSSCAQGQTTQQQILQTSILSGSAPALENGLA